MAKFKVLMGEHCQMENGVLVTYRGPHPEQDQDGRWRRNADGSLYYTPPEVVESKIDLCKRYNVLGFDPKFERDVDDVTTADQLRARMAADAERLAKLESPSPQEEKGAKREYAAKNK